MEANETMKKGRKEACFSVGDVVSCSAYGTGEALPCRQKQCLSHVGFVVSVDRYDNNMVYHVCGMRCSSRQSPEVCLKVAASHLLLVSPVHKEKEDFS